MIDDLRSLSPALRSAWVVAFGTLVTFALSLTIVIPRIAGVLQFRVRDPWFPAVLQHPAPFVLTLVAVLVVGLVAVVRPTLWTLRAWAYTLTVGAMLCLVHQASFGWAGGVLMFWSGVWVLWLTHVKRGLERGPFFCLVLLGGIFAFPALGKMTPGFESGEIYWQAQWSFKQGIHGWLDSALGTDGHRTLAAYYGRVSIVVESLLSLVWLTPGRWGFGLVLLGVAGILLTAGVQFIDAMGLLGTLALSGLVLASDPRVRGATEAG